MGGSVVVDLLCKLPAKCYNVYFDNLFTSLPLIETLKAIGMHGTGTVRQNRLQACPLAPATEVKKKDRGFSESVIYTSSGLLICRWNDNSVVMSYLRVQQGDGPESLTKRYNKFQYLF
ncbi:hypothetical protein SNE40_017175 [Patella caerulea]|uniref:PiggyBac transposable element-derived protein domain-containing protein n=1 Tax=Patella caerulea TaxID=87958 RepID=A0AAN8PPN9_PATCE